MSPPPSKLQKILTNTKENKPSIVKTNIQGNTTPNSRKRPQELQAIELSDNGMGMFSKFKEN